MNSEATMEPVTNVTLIPDRQPRQPSAPAGSVPAPGFVPHVRQPACQIREIRAETPAAEDERVKK